MIHDYCTVPGWTERRIQMIESIRFRLNDKPVRIRVDGGL